MTDHEEAQDYTALGASNYGFRTSATNIINGVDVVGKSIGVRGVSAGGDPGQPDFQAAGVVGEGTVQGQGVRGHSQLYAGVEGTSEGSPGVQGTSYLKSSGKGVEGVGATGVFGLAFRNSIELDETGRATEGVGVLGEADEGAGVKGTSPQGRGGVFESKFGAPLRLMPQEGGDKAPSKGQIGDFIVRLLFPPHQGDERQREVAELWFCFESDGKDHPAAWAKVQMTPF